MKQQMNPKISKIDNIKNKEGESSVVKEKKQKRKGEIISCEKKPTHFQEFPQFHSFYK